MATETEDRTTFRSNLRKEQNRSAGGTRDRRRVFEDSGGSTYTSSGVTSRYTRATHHDRTESPSSGSKTSSSISSRFNKLNVHDDGHDDREEDKEEKKEDDCEEEEPTSRRFQKKTGGPSLANKINKSNNDDDDEAEDEEDNKKEEEEQAAPKKQIKKSKGTGSGQKRKERKHLREKRRSTGVVIMPGQPVALGDDEGKQVHENTLKNMGDVGTCEGAAASSSVSSADMDAQQAKSEQVIEDLKEELAKVVRELDTLRSANVRLKDENSALLRVVESLSSGGTGRC